MFQLMAFRKTRPTMVAALVTRMADAVRSVVAPQTLFTPVPAVVEADTSEFFTEAEMPAAEDIAEALAQFARAADNARAAERVKRRSKKLIDRLASGVYGRWEVVREPSGRATVDLEAVRAHYKSLGLDVPMKPSAMTLRVNRVVVDAPELAEQEFAALAAAMTR